MVEISNQDARQLVRLLQVLRVGTCKSCGLKESEILRLGNRALLRLKRKIDYGTSEKK